MPTEEQKAEQLKHAHNNNILSVSYQQLNKRFKQHLSQTTYSDETMEEAFLLFTEIFRGDAQTDTDEAKQIFANQFAELIEKRLSEEESTELQKPFTSEELFKNLKKLHLKGPSSPGQTELPMRYGTWHGA